MKSSNDCKLKELIDAIAKNGSLCTTIIVRNSEVIKLFPIERKKIEVKYEKKFVEYLDENFNFVIREE